MTQPVDPFDDPMLKAALKGALGRESAPAGLRDRIRVALDDVESSVRPERRLFLFRSPVMSVAIAAMVAIAIALAVKFYPTGAGAGGGRKLVAVLPQPVAQAMVAVHDSSNAAAATAELAADDRSARQKELTEAVGFPALVPSLGGQWVCREAKVATIDGWKSAQVIYTRGDQSISLFSIPAGKAYSPPDGATYEMNVERHAIAGFVRGKSMYCAVGSENVPIDDLKALTNALAKS